MKAKKNKRFQTTIIVIYSRSNTTRKVSFDTFEEAKAVVEEQKQKHHVAKRLTTMCLIVQKRKAY